MIPYAMMAATMPQRSRADTGTNVLKESEPASVPVGLPVDPALVP